MTKEMLDLTPATAHGIFSAKKHKMVARGLLVAAMAGGLAFGMSMPAAAAPPNDTVTTFNLTAGSLTFAVAQTASLTDAAAIVASQTITGPLGEVSVTDARGGILGWVMSASSGTFVNSASVSTGVSYSSGVVTGKTGTSELAGSTAVSLPGSVVTATAVSGYNTLIFNPTIVVSLPGSALAGLYTGTVTTSLV